MIKINVSSDQVLSKDDFITNGKYKQEFRFCGIKLWSKNSEVNNKVLEENFKSDEKVVGFGKK